MAGFNEQLFEKKLLGLKDTQDSISGLSSWCLQQPQHHKKIVQIWLQVLKKVKIEQRLSLFYLANDVIQNSKRKGYDFVESWGTALQRATTMVRGDDKVRTKVLRLFTIWNERNIYDESFLVDLVGLLSSRTPAQASVPDAQDFQPSALISKVRSCKTLEDDTDLRLKIVNESHLQLSDADALRSSLKDRRHGEDVVAEVEDGIDKMEAYIKALELEIKERQELIELLDLADVFYETQKGEARIVCNEICHHLLDQQLFQKGQLYNRQLLLNLFNLLLVWFNILQFNQSITRQSNQFITHRFTISQLPLILFIMQAIILKKYLYNYRISMNLPHHHRLVQFPHHSPRHNKHLCPPFHNTIVLLCHLFLVMAKIFPLMEMTHFSAKVLEIVHLYLLFKNDPPRDVGKNDLDTPASPPPENLADEIAFLMNCHLLRLKRVCIPRHSMYTLLDFGKPIEVISTKNDTGFSLADFLKSLMPSQDNTQANRVTSNEIEPPGIDTPVIGTSVPPPNIDENFQEKLWNSNLPPKFPSWSDSQASWGEGVNSPPGYKEGFGNSLDYEIPVPEDSSEDDVLRPPPAIEIDHRNLISLTGSPLNNDNNQWQPQPVDVDYRKIPLPDNRDIVESVDMEMSDEEDPQLPGSFTSVKLKPPPPTLLTSLQKNQLNRKIHKSDLRSPLEPLTGGQSQSISFNISVANKILTESPLKEKEEPKKKLPLHNLNPSPPKNIIELSEIMPPPLPPMSTKPEIHPGNIGVEITSQKSVNRLPNEDDKRGVPELKTEQHLTKKDENVVVPQNNSSGPKFPNTNSRFCGPNNAGPRFPNPVPGPGFSIVEQGNNIACQILDLNNPVSNIKNE
ncbi:uncharacterized protein LOC142321322 [Lycorma delicatula]|uniref:uncharacterized protein LOC142321322 n=1 Tax=Lycorma delicatula TaxID=130591 RepID=UPI003F519567